ncbi:hypothetical protein [Phormidesmis sp. 146-33]
MKLNSSRFRQVFLPISIIAFAIFTGNLRANAEDPNSTESLPVNQSEIDWERVRSNKPAQVSVAQIASRVADPIPGEVPTSASELTGGQAFLTAQTTTTPGVVTPANGADTLAPSGSITAPNATPNATPNTVPNTVPNTTPNTGVNQTPVESIPQTQPIQPPESTPQTTPSPAAQTTEVSPGRVTRSGSSYIGVGGNIGIGSGDTELGQGSFAVLSKIGLLPSVSVRPSVLFSDDVTILVPVTYDFSFGEGPTGGLGFAAAPFVGVGVAISTGDDAEVGLLLTGGIDVPLSSQFTATASVNASVTGEAAIGILLGVGYNFQGF